MNDVEKILKTTFQGNFPEIKKKKNYIWKEYNMYQRMLTLNDHYQDTVILTFKGKN